MFYYDPTYFLVIIAAVLTMAVQAYMTSTFSKYQQIESKSGLNAYQAASMILSGSGINNVKIGHVAGNLTDHYAPTKKELNLSDTTYNSRSIASIGVAAHECGHAIQDYKKMVLLNFQMAIVPVVNFASSLSIPVILIGIVLGMNVFCSDAFVRRWRGIRIVCVNEVSACRGFESDSSHTSFIVTHETFHPKVAHMAVCRIKPALN